MGCPPDKNRSPPGQLSPEEIEFFTSLMDRLRCEESAVVSFSIDDDEDFADLPELVDVSTPTNSAPPTNKRTHDDFSALECSKSEPRAYLQSKNGIDVHDRLRQKSHLTKSLISN